MIKILSNTKWTNKNYQTLLNFCQIGNILPNLVTLVLVVVVEMITSDPVC